MKLHIKEKQRKIDYPNTTSLKRLVEPVKTKGARKKVKPTPSDNSTKRSPSYFEHVDTYLLDSPISKYQKSVFNCAHINKPSPLTLLSKIIHINEMLVFMHTYIEWITYVKDGDNCGCHVISTLLSKGEKMMMNVHKESYTKLYRIKEHFDEINESLIPCVGSPTLETKWMCFPKMDHLIASEYNMVYIDLTIGCIMCISCLSKSQHFVQVSLKLGCPIPQT